MSLRSWTRRGYTRSRTLLRALNTLANVYGIDAQRMLRSLAATPRYCWDFACFARAVGQLPTPLPVLGERDHLSGSGHYFHGDLWAARRILARKPAHHVDVGSRLDGLLAHLLAANLNVTFVDFRPVANSIAGLRSIQADATHLDTVIPQGTLDSLSSLHAVEHFGLGRYGDPIQPAACDRAMHQMESALAPGGRLYLGVPIGRERIEFNAHRVLHPERILDTLSALRLVNFAAVDDDGKMIATASPTDFRQADYACGLYEFERSV